MGAGAKVTSWVMRVSELDRSVHFYCDVFACQVSVREPDAALLLTPDGFQIYLHARSPSKRPPIDSVGVQYVLWATDNETELHQITTRLHAHDPATYTHTANGVTFVEARDPDGIRVLLAHPSPAQLPRELIAPQFH